MFSKISFRSRTDKEMFIENVFLLCPTKKVNFWLSSQTRTGCYNKVVEKRRKKPVCDARAQTKFAAAAGSSRSRLNCHGRIG